MSSTYYFYNGKITWRVCATGMGVECASEEQFHTVLTENKKVTTFYRFQTKINKTL